MFNPFKTYRAKHEGGASPTEVEETETETPEYSKVTIFGCNPNGSNRVFEKVEEWETQEHEISFYVGSDRFVFGGFKYLIEE